MWPWGDLLPNVVDMPHYRAIKLHADTEADTLSIEVLQVKLTMTDDGRKAGAYEWLCDSAVALRPMLRGSDDARRAALAQVLRPYMPTHKQGLFWAGADLGERNDPTEICIGEQIGDVLHDRLRIQLRGFPYHLQEELIFLVDGHFAHLPFWGVDLGSAGTVVVKDLHAVDRFAGARFEDRMLGFHFQQSVECIGEDGEPLEEEDHRSGQPRVITAPAKHWATQCISARLQRGGYAMAFDTDVLNDMATQTARPGAKWPIYSKGADHAPDARRLQMLRQLRAMLDGGGIDLFASGVSERAAA